MANLNFTYSRGGEPRKYVKETGSYLLGNLELKFLHSNLEGKLRYDKISVWSIHEIKFRV